MGVFKRSREGFLDDHFEVGNWRSRGFSGTSYALWRAARSVTIRYCKGTTLDAGAGRGSWRSTILEVAAAYESIDVAPRGDHRPTYTGDVCAMPQVPNSCYDAIVCHQVLEHLRRPGSALDEFHRVLRPEGTLILSVPHLSRRHELPHDYFRFTQEGVAALLVDHGFEPLEIAAYGGMLSFLHHQSSFLMPGLFSRIPLLGVAASAINYPISKLVVWLDEWSDPDGLFATGVVAAARRT